MLVAAPGAQRSRERARSRTVVVRHAGPAVVRMAIVAALLSPVLRVQNRADDDDFYVQMVAVDPRWRGRGYGKMLMAAAEEAARDTGCRRVVLDVEETNVPAIGLYQRLGYHTVSRSGRPWLVTKPPVLRMVKTV
jgi:ribosomal protein S18 acetylase RimI-like enzyme